MNRRQFLASSAAVGAGISTAGCLGVFGSDNVVLDEPENYDELRASRDGGHLDFPIHGDELPEVTVPDALADESLSTHEYIGDRHIVMTFIFTRCTMTCPGLVNALARTQLESLEEGYDDELAFLPMTFDPEHDTPSVLEDYSQARGADLAADNWHFLRPEDAEHAEAVIGDELGLWYEYLTPEEREEEGMAEHMAFRHMDSILVANKDGYVERNYTMAREIPNAAGLIDIVETLQERW